MTKWVYLKSWITDIYGWKVPENCLYYMKVKNKLGITLNFCYP